MKFIPLIISIACTTGVFAQGTATRQYYVKAYANGSISAFNAPNIYYNSHLGYDLHIKPVNVLSPSVAFTMRNKRGNMHEIEWNKLNINTTVTSVRFLNPATGVYYYGNSQKLHTTLIALRYEYIRVFGKNKHWKVQPSIGFAAMPYYNRYNSKPYFSSDIPTSQTSIGMKNFIIPRINIALNKSMTLDMNIPLCVLDMGSVRQRIDNPTLPVSARTYSVVDITAFPQYYTARIGLAVKL